MTNDKWTKRLFSTPKKVQLYERERVLVDATEAVCQVMREQNVTRSDLAHRLKVTQANVTQILSGERNLTLGTLSDVFVALGRSLIVASAPLSGERCSTLAQSWKLGSRADNVIELEQISDCIDTALVA